MPDNIIPQGDDQAWKKAVDAKLAQIEAKMQVLETRPIGAA